MPAHYQYGPTLPVAPQVFHPMDDRQGRILAFFGRPLKAEASFRMPGYS